MATAVTVSVPRGRPFRLAFPRRCVSCGAEASRESTLVVTRFVTEPETGEQAPVRLAHEVPHCERCARATKALFLAQLVPFLLGFVAAGGAAFVVAVTRALAVDLDDVGRPGSASSLLVGAAAGLAGGLVGGVAAELLARVLLLPVFGGALLRAPLLASTFVSDADHVAGLTGTPNADATEITLTFTNDEVGREFARLNGTGSPAPDGSARPATGGRP